MLAADVRASPDRNLAIGGDERGEPTTWHCALASLRTLCSPRARLPRKRQRLAEEVADVVELLHRMERRLVRVEVLVSSTLGGVGLVAAGVLATMLKVYFG
jgi:hypothetical protein